MEINYYNRTFDDLKSSRELGLNDTYHIMTSLNGKMREAFLNNPSGYDDNDTCQILALDGKTVIGCINTFQTRVKAGENIVSAQSGSYLTINEQYRKTEAGADLFMFFTNLHKTRWCMVGGISQMALRMYKSMRYAIFLFPRLIYLRKSKSVINWLFKSDSLFLKPIIWISDMFLFLHRNLLFFSTYSLRRRYKIAEESKSFEDVEKIVMEDDFHYKEVHDRKWFEWALNFSFSEDPRCQKHLYTIKKDGNVEGFFLIKLEFFKEASSRGFKNVYLGTILEWGASKNSSLSEADIYLLALSYFPAECDGIQVASNNPSTLKSLKRRLFVQVGMSNIAAKLGKLKLSEYNHMELWRVRLASGDTIMD